MAEINYERSVEKDRSKKTAQEPQPVPTCCEKAMIKSPTSAPAQAQPAVAKPAGKGARKSSRPPKM